MDRDTIIRQNISAFYKNKFAKQKMEENYRKRAQKEIIENNYKEKYIKEKIKQNYEELVKEDIGYRLINNLAKRASKTLKAKFIFREFTHSELIGCDKDELKLYLSSKFTDNMSFDNYGLWELDHIKPIASFNLDNIEEQKKCFNYTNIQPLWKEDNMKKSDKINWIKTDF
jgi:hypothetical protein